MTSDVCEYHCVSPIRAVGRFVSLMFAWYWLSDQLLERLKNIRAMPKRGFGIG